MNRISAFFALHLRVAWALVAAISLAVAGLVAWSDLRGRELQLLSQLQTEAQRSSIQIMSTTLNGNLMGSITLLGLIDRDIKQEVSNGLMSIDAHIPITLSTLGNSFGAEGVFLVGDDGIVKSSWDRVNKPSTGLDVKFRPYYQMAMKGQTSVYAAISMARGDRSLYFTAPVYTERARATSGIGAVVARTNLEKVDALLKGEFDRALLLSPQGVVFASSRPEWVGMMDGVADAQRLNAIRELKQFGKMFEDHIPQTLPVSVRHGMQTVEGQRFAVATADVNWNDPSGAWKLVLMADLANTVPLGPSTLKASVALVIAMLLGWMWLHLLQGRHAQMLSNLQLQAYATQQEAAVAYRAELAGASVRLQRCETLDQLAQQFFVDARPLLGAVQCVLYVADIHTPHALLLAGSAACAEPPPNRLELGQGVLGQCAQNQDMQTIATPPDGLWTVRSGLGNTRPAALLLAPIVMQDTLIGALELAVMQVPDDASQAKFEEFVAVLANALEILRRNLQLQQLASVS
jgi:C4-dicarboxylate-specific signal transduction histidine kinase